MKRTIYDFGAHNGDDIPYYTGQRQKLGFFKWLRVP
jgi:hypothetical protein